MLFKELVENAKKEQRLKNIQEVREDINASWVKDKIYKHIEAFDGLFTFDQIKQEILNNDIVASKFCKDPSKQNISEKLAADLLKAKKLPSQGANCIRFSPNGDICSKSQGNSKSADFLINNIYATQKYTKESGGAQDNQKHDVIEFLRNGAIHHKVMAILDGDYWDNSNRDELKSIFANEENVVITSVDELL